MKAKFRGLIGKLLNKTDNGFAMNTSLIFGTEDNFGTYTVMSFKNDERKEVRLANGKMYKYSYIQIVDNKLNISRYRFDADATKVVNIVNEVIASKGLHFQNQEF
tara:strand:- start:261 stop:575 length:315 start_codon:yes stop_codon:yes gene_type:complete